jgi:hypothetical protein
MGMAPVIISGLLQGFGLGCTQVPLNILALSTLPRHILTQGTAIRSLMRNLGGSIGISVLVANHSGQRRWRLRCPARRYPARDLTTHFADAGRADRSAVELSIPTIGIDQCLSNNWTHQRRGKAYHHVFRPTTSLSTLRNGRYRTSRKTWYAAAS